MSTEDIDREAEEATKALLDLSKAGKAAVKQRKASIASAKKIQDEIDYAALLAKRAQQDVIDYDDEVLGQIDPKAIAKAAKSDDKDDDSKKKDDADKAKTKKAEKKSKKEDKADKVAKKKAKKAKAKAKAKAEKKAAKKAADDAAKVGPKPQFWSKGNWPWSWQQWLGAIIGVVIGGITATIAVFIIAQIPDVLVRISLSTLFTVGFILIGFAVGSLIGFRKSALYKAWITSKPKPNSKSDKKEH